MLRWIWLVEGQLEQGAPVERGCRSPFAFIAAREKDRERSPIARRQTASSSIMTARSLEWGRASAEASGYDESPALDSGFLMENEAPARPAMSGFKREGRWSWCLV
jgi:hypothetical protein